ncbi:MAG: DUF177 domain-containing protein [Coriobacteriales bacterium]|nr:DUF177 domain-containing protein [Coriobacteriales bacterium]MBQ6585177.1 DUF177 domain-containing protein [Coriobacteriales bacterium]
MDELIVRILPELDEAGTVKHVQGELDLPAYESGRGEFRLLDGLSYDAYLSHTGDSILLTGTIKGRAMGSCDRCLEDAVFDIDGELEGLYFIRTDSPLMQDMEEDEYEIIGDSDVIDLTNAVLASLAFETPFVLLCSEDCKGLCPHCGSNLNEGDCGCAQDHVDPLNPFAALKGLKFD